MIKIHERGRAIYKELIESYTRISTATLGHILEFGFIAELKPLFPVKMVGPALTVKAPSIDSTAVHLALDYAEPGDVLVIDRCGDNAHACLGGIVAYAGRKKGVIGAVVDGSITDTEELLHQCFPVFYRQISPLTTRILGYEGEINTQASICGVVVNSGDLIVADNDGIVVLSPKKAEELINVVVKRQEREKEIIDKIDSGTPLSSISGANKYKEDKF